MADNIAGGIFQLQLCCRWRTSFLWSLIFGVPAMVIMMYFMFSPAPEEEEAHGAMMNMTMNHTETTTRKMTGGHGNMIMLIPGLSLDNLLLFLLATPVQVRTTITEQHKPIVSPLPVFTPEKNIGLPSVRQSVSLSVSLSVR